MVNPFSYPITFLPCNSLEEIRPFYEKILQLPVALEQARCILYRIGSKAYWGFCDHYSEKIIDPERICLTLVVDTQHDVDKWHSHLVSNQVPCKKSPAYNRTFKIYNAFYYDPTGYTIEIQVFDTNAHPL
ncbi:MAG: VOC family protein [Candidatus Lokiarchaeota archaeon]|nr:VOC family protein [Candidatus Lokiarchaeota archaeon]